MFQALIKGLGGTLETYFLTGAPTSCIVSVYTDMGALKVSAQSCTVDTLSLALASDADAGDTSIDLASTTGIIMGRRYRLNAANGTAESVVIRNVAGAAATLWGPLALDHEATDTLVGTRVSYSVSSSAADVLWWDGYAVFTPSSGDEQTETVDCVRRKIPDNLIDLSDLAQVIPKLTKSLSVELDLSRALREARDEMLIDLGGKNRAHTILGVDHFRRQAALKFWLLRRLEFGDEWNDTMDVIQREYDARKEHIIAQAPVDADQDGITSGVNDGGFTVISLERA